MHVDALTLAALAAELRRDLIGTRVEDAIQPTPRAVALQCWGGGRTNWLLLSAHPQLARVHLLDRKPRKLAVEPPPFVMLLRKHLEGARVVAIDQPPWERVLAIGFARRPSTSPPPPSPQWGTPPRRGEGSRRIDDSQRGGEEGRAEEERGAREGRCLEDGEAGDVSGPIQPSVWLVAEIMGRLSNLILRDDAGIILGALHLVGPEVNRYRTIAPNQPYVPPPPQTRTLDDEILPRPRPETITAADLAEAAAAMLAAADHPGRPPRVANLFASHVLGFGPDLGREVAARAAGAPEAPLTADLPWEALARAARSLAAPPATGAWHPTLVLAPEQIHKEDTKDTEGRGEGAGGETPSRESSAAPDYMGTAGDISPLSPPRPSASSAKPPMAGSPTGGLDPVSAVHVSSPPLLVATEAERTPVAYAVYQPRQYAGHELVAMPSVNALLAAYYRHAEWRDAIDGARAGPRRALVTHRDRCLRKADVLRAELAQRDEAQHLREEAELLLTFQMEVPPRAATFTLPDPFAAPSTDGSPVPAVTIALDPRLTAVENANRRFARYHKLRRAAELIPPQIAANDLEIARLDQLLTDLALADTPVEVAHVRAEVAEAGYLRGAGAGGKLTGKKVAKSTGAKGKPGKRGKPDKPGAVGGEPLRRTSSDGFTLLVGKNSRQNEEVTFHRASGGDLWLHARGVPGAHVIVKSGGRPVPESTLQEAAALAAYYCQARGARAVPVDYTEQRYVRHMKGGGPGMVIYERERTLHAAPADPAAE